MIEMTIHINRTTMIAAVAILAVAAVALKLLPLGTVLTLALVLACPLMMLFMHGGHRAEHGESAATDPHRGANEP